MGANGPLRQMHGRGVGGVLWCEVWAEGCAEVPRSSKMVLMRTKRFCGILNSNFRTCNRPFLVNVFLSKNVPPGRVGQRE